jgi:hypothetical protein
VSHFVSRGRARSIVLIALLLITACAAPTVDQPPVTHTPAMSQPGMTHTPAMSQPTMTQAPVVSQPTATSTPASEPTPPAFDVRATAERALLDHQIAA